MAISSLKNFIQRRPWLNVTEKWYYIVEVNSNNNQAKFDKKKSSSPDLLWTIVLLD